MRSRRLDRVVLGRALGLQLLRVGPWWMDYGNLDEDIEEYGCLGGGIMFGW